MSDVTPLTVLVTNRIQALDRELILELVPMMRDVLRSNGFTPSEDEVIAAALRVLAASILGLGAQMCVELHIDPERIVKNVLLHEKPSN